MLANGTRDLTTANPQPVLATTRWSVVLTAQHRPPPESAAALETLCRASWHPLYAYVRCCGHSPHDAQDLPQESLCRLLEKRWLDSTDPEKGRARGSAKHGGPEQL
jgi:hypothetical protein